MLGNMAGMNQKDCYVVSLASLLCGAVGCRVQTTVDFPQLQHSARSSTFLS